MKNPKNVEAVRNWLKANKADSVESFDFLLEASKDAQNTQANGLLGFILIGFEAGRDFQRNSPDVEPGVGYLNS